MSDDLPGILCYGFIFIISLGIADEISTASRPMFPQTFEPVVYAQSFLAPSVKTGDIKTI